MTADTAAAIAGLVERYGLPLAMLGTFLFLVIKRIFVTGAEYRAMVTLFERERVDRMAAEQTIAKFATVNAEVAEAVRDVLSEVVKRPDVYAERLAGPTRRAR